MEFSIEVIHLMHPGQRKDRAGNPHQEDSIFPKAEKLNDSDRLFIVCDGMGGHDAGDIASDTVCQAIGNYITSECKPTDDFSSKVLNKALDAAYDALDAADTGGIRKMGTTMALLKFYNKGAIVAHIGDSRVYHIRPQQNHKPAKVLHRTYDHSLVFNMVKAGIMTEEEARTSPHRNVITKALQPHPETPTSPDLTKITDIRPGDFFYLCSDGMLENMDSPELEDIFSKEGDDLRKLRDALLNLTEENHDNHTAIIIKILSVEKSGDEDLSDDFDNYLWTPSVMPPIFRKEKYENSSASNGDTSYKDDEFTYLYNGDEPGYDDNKPQRRWLVFAILTGILGLCAILAFIIRSL